MTPGSVHPSKGTIFSEAPVAIMIASPFTWRISSPMRTTISLSWYNPITVAFNTTLTPSSLASFKSSSPIRKPLIFALCSFDPKNLWICLNNWPPGRAFSSKTMTCIPVFAASIAADKPEGPAPTMIKSYLSICIRIPLDSIFTASVCCRPQDDCLPDQKALQSHRTESLHPFLPSKESCRS